MGVPPSRGTSRTRMGHLRANRGADVLLLTARRPSRQRNLPHPSRSLPFPACTAVNSELGRVRLQGVNNELNVDRQLHPEIGRPAINILAGHVSGEPLGLHLLLDTGGRHVANASRPDQGRGGHESAKLVASVENLVQWSYPRAVLQVVGV